ncbi:MAG TPA: hypothetical protein VGE48_00240 [Candidatus Paceibacterota bacterium]
MSQNKTCKRVFQAISRTLAQLDDAMGTDLDEVARHIRMHAKFETLSRKVYKSLVIEATEISNLVREVVVKITRVSGHFQLEESDSSQEIVHEIEQTIRLENQHGRWTRVSAYG